MSGRAGGLPVVVLAGGLGTRLAEETDVRPKPMVEIGGRPILWHILKHYAHYGHSEFLIALGYKGEYIKRWFIESARLQGSRTVRLRTGEVEAHAGVDSGLEDWTLHLMETGLETMTGGRLWRLRDRLRGGTFLLTYGDGVSDVDLGAMLAFHRREGRLATVTAVRPPARFGGLELEEGGGGCRVGRFTEKPQAGEGWINGGYMALEPAVLDRLGGDGAVLEVDLLERLAAEGQLSAWRHGGFWQCMDTLRDRRYLEERWARGDAPWRVWG